MFLSSGSGSPTVLVCPTTKKKALHSFKISGTAHPRMQYNIPEDSNLQQHCYENLQSQSFQLLSLLVVLKCVIVISKLLI